MEKFEYTIVTQRRHGDWLQAGPEPETLNKMIAGQDEKLDPAVILNRFGAEGWDLLRTDYPGDSGTLFFLFRRQAPKGYSAPAAVLGQPRPT